MSVVAPAPAGARLQRPPKRIANGCRVSGALGRSIDNPNPTIKRKHKERLFGTVICAVDRNKYRVRLDNGQVIREGKKA